mmetsp:Transcript_32361/g.58774  ORF Transcript_32361/g.58774 Transcript_32361/m.58774 type:complete len:472 (-) Transcript_32361:146-1561(-)
MLRMIRSARSRINRDGLDDPTADRGVLHWPSVDSTAEGFQDADRPAKRLSTSRQMVGTNRSRLSRCRTSLDGQKGTENVPSLPQTLPAPTAVLGDVTNTTGQPLPAHWHKSTPSDAAGAVKQITKETGLSKVNGSGPSSPREVETVEMDAAHAEDPQYVVDYVSDIYRHLKVEEAHMRPAPDYMDRQLHVNSKMRAILVDWLVDVHKRYKLRPESLFLAISIVDRFLEVRVTARRYLQLVGVTALLIAAKFEELYPPQISDFVYVTDKTYTKEEVIKMEVLMLSALDFNVCRPTAVHFLERYQRINGCTEAHKDLVQYLLELTLIDYKMVKYPPSHLAAAAVLLSNKLLKRQPSWTPAAVKYTKMPEHSLKECAKEMCGLLEQAETSPLQAVRKKFSQLKHHAVAKLNFSGNPAPPPAAPTPTPNGFGLGHSPPTSQQAFTPSILPPPMSASASQESRAPAVSRRLSAPTL